MPTVRSVPNPYATIATALAAADPGDTLLLEPGYYGSAITINKPVHIKVNTTDVINNKAYISGEYVQGGDNRTLNLSFAYDPNVPEVLIEGLTVYGYYNSNSYITNGCIAVNAGDTRVIFSRCVIESPYSTNNTSYLNKSRFVYVPSGLCNLQFINCTRHQRTESGVITGYTYCDIEQNVTNPASSVVFEKSVIYSAPTTSTLSTGSLALWADDSVRADTEGYGVEYGSWLIDNYANFYRVAGTVSIPTADPMSVEVQLFYATNTGLKRYSAAVTYPDAAGNWEFNYLSPGDRYYVALVPPAGYKPELMGPYDPET